MRFSRLAVLAACTVGTVACYLAIPTSGATFQDHKTGTITITVVIPSASATRPAPDPSSAASKPVDPSHGRIVKVTPTEPTATKTTRLSPAPKASPTQETKPAVSTSPTATTISPTTSKGGASSAPTP